VLNVLPLEISYTVFTQMFDDLVVDYVMVFCL